MVIVDTNVAIHLRDGHRPVIERLLGLTHRPSLSLISLVELESGIAEKTERATLRRSRLARMLAAMDVLAFDDAVVAAYRDILDTVGFSRRRILDRLIAATAIVHDMTLVTINAADFADIPGLRIEAWPAP